MEPKNINKGNGNILYVLKVLQKYSDIEHPMTKWDIQEKVEEEFHISLDERTIRRYIELLQYKEELNYDIESTREGNYWINRNPETEFEPGEVRAIIDTFNYADYIVPGIAKNIIRKCKNLQNVYENQKLKNYKIYGKDSKTTNMEVVKNIEDITDAINEGVKITFEYWKFDFSPKIYNKIEPKKVSKPKVSPYALVYDKQQFYMIAVKEGENDFFRYRLDRIKNLILTSEKVLPKKESEIKEFAKNSIYQFGGNAEEIEAIVENSLLNGVIDDFGNNVRIERVDDNYFKINLVSDDLGFQMWAMRNIDKVTVVKPESLKNKIKEIIWLAGERYGK